jgi:hypothetical protein
MTHSHTSFTSPSLLPVALTGEGPLLNKACRTRRHVRMRRLGGKAGGGSVDAEESRDQEYQQIRCVLYVSQGGQAPLWLHCHNHGREEGCCMRSSAH